MGANWDSGDPVNHRILYYERIQQGEKSLIRFFPWYQVQYPGMHGKMFEPVDCLKRKQLGGDVNNSSQYPEKEINEIREYDGRQKLFVGENNGDGTEIVLHTCDAWEWPR